MQLSVCRGSHSNDVVRYGMVRIGRYGIDRQCPTTKGNADDEGLVGIFVLLVRGHHVVVCLPFAAWTYFRVFGSIAAGRARASIRTVRKGSGLEAVL